MDGRGTALSLADPLGGLDEHEWRIPSLCPHWTVHDVLAHLTLGTRTTVRDLLVGLIRSGGDFSRMEARMSRDRAARFGPAELVTQFRSNAASRRRSPGSGPLDPLVDALVHRHGAARRPRRRGPCGLVPCTPSVAYPEPASRRLRRRLSGTPGRGVHGMTCERGGPAR
ncbi:maleylpyruvate isomerase N-terminal domain-containing protein [Plantactinospora veratri]|uniref:Maleylpyruvate isomerase N-terminal domain-containing protein n=1 Tax=Plantactinospora veratri TaxID=1436122 RepID=A0ABU7SMK8_9ACTN